MSTTPKRRTGCLAHQRVTHQGHPLRIWCALEDHHHGPHTTVAGVTFTDHEHDGGRR